MSAEEGDTPADTAGETNPSYELDLPEPNPGKANPPETGPSGSEKESQRSPPPSSGGSSPSAARYAGNEDTEAPSVGSTQDMRTLVEPAGDDSSSRGSNCCRGQFCWVTAAVFAALSVLVGVVMLAGVYDDIFDNILHKHMQIVPDSEAYDIWVNTPVPMALSFYFFNLTNPEEFKNGSKAILEEVGPYVYQEFHKKTQIDYHPNKTVSYFQQRWWTWDSVASGNHTEDDVISILNTVPVSSAYAVRDHPLLLQGLDVAFESLGEQITRTVTVRDNIFAGYEDPILTFVHNFTDSANGSYPNLDAKLTIPSGILDYDRMGWFYNRNMSETYDGRFSMFTGEDTLDHVGGIDTWNLVRDTKYYTPPCNRVYGSAGEIWPPDQTATNISFYSSDLCMTITLPYKEPFTDEYGLEGFRYWADNKTFANPSVVPEHQCYCFENTTCYPSGLLDAQTCRMGSPAFISFPHFLHGDPSLREAVEGVSPPIEERHQFILDVIPEIGTPVAVNARMQINMDVRPYHFITIMKDLPKVILPLLWFEVNTGITSELAASLKPVMFLLHSPTITIIFSLMVVLGLLVLAYIAFRTTRAH